ncbi:MAG: transglutaminase domain-containing protein [Spirochaetes bacterium]|nr:transglutaminase domain-containing protein [Spirochaetota bacterium]
MDQYTSRTYFIESDDPSIVDFARSRSSGAGDDTGRAVKIFYAVRDEVRYNPYCYSFHRDQYRAGLCLERMEGFCIQKAILLAAVSRALGIPCRLGFANVVNHLATERMKELMRTDLFVFHGYNEFFLKGRWVKATPAFNIALCEKFGILPLDFDGEHDSVFHPFDKSGQRHMEYVHDYGPFADFPFQMMIDESLKYYPHLAQFMKSGVEAAMEGGADPEL